MEDYYSELGVARGATPQEIQKAYRAMARKYHPDMNPNDKKAQEKFKKVQQAYDVLNDPDKRKKYDQFGPGFEQMPHGGGGGPGGNYQDVDYSQFFGGGGMPTGFEDIFQQFTGGGAAGGRGKKRRPQRGDDISARMQIPFNVAVTGGTCEVRVPRGGKMETLTVKVPAGIEDGRQMRLRGKGGLSPTGGLDGDLLLTVNVSAHPYFSRKGNDLEVKVPVTFAEAALGAKVDVPSPKGTITLSIPPGTSSGKRLRVRGYGIEAEEEKGDLYAEVEIALPGKFSDVDAELIRKLDKDNPFHPRKGLVW